MQFFGSAVRGRFSRGGSQPLVGRHLKGRSGRTWRRGRGACKAIRKISGMGTLLLDKKLAAAVRVFAAGRKARSQFEKPAPEDAGAGVPS